MQKNDFVLRLEFTWDGLNVIPISSSLFPTGISPHFCLVEEEGNLRGIILPNGRSHVTPPWEGLHVWRRFDTLKELDKYYEINWMIINPFLNVNANE
jgi:hypothetical protein